MKCLAATIAACALAASPAHALQLAGYDGSNPFNCTIQAAGTGTQFGDPGADPLCVEYDKTHQNVDHLGIVTFLSQEPARTAATANKCFYFQTDHWYSSVVATDQSTAIYNWDGAYFFDRARGVGGAFVRNFTINNSSGDPAATPGFPADWRPYFGYGRGGVQALDGIAIDPICAAYARTHDVYAHRAGSGVVTGQAPGRRAPRLALRLRYWHGRHGCARSALRTSLTGADAGDVARVDYTARGRLAGTARKPPFRGRIELRALARGHARRVGALVTLRDGRSLTLLRRVTACARRRS